MMDNQCPPIIFLNFGFHLNFLFPRDVSISNKYKEVIILSSFLF